MTIDSDSSPKWTWTTKLVATLTIVAIIAFFIVRFSNLLGPLLLVAILYYLFYPLADHLRRWFKIPWRVAVTIIYLLVVLILAGLLTLGGFALVEQLQSLITFLDKTINDLPQTIANLQSQVLVFGPFRYDLSQSDLGSISNQILSVVEPLLGRIGGLLGTFATGAASGLGWLAFVLIISYFVLAETGGIPNSILTFNIPGYGSDLRRLVDKLGNIWNSFLRGQLIIIGITIVLYSILLGSLGVHYYIGLACLAGLARLVPYVGPFVAWTTYGLVTYFQGSTIFGLTEWGYVILVIAIAMVTDYILDNFVNTKIMSNALKVHPAAVLLAALIGANLIGFVGVLLAAPVLATLKLFSQYTTRKLFDLDPWEGISEMEGNKPLPPLARHIQVFVERVISRVRKLIGGSETLMGFVKQMREFFLRLAHWVQKHSKQKSQSPPVDPPSTPE